MITILDSFYATVGAIVAVGAWPVFADVGDRMKIDPDLIRPAVSARTKAVIPVHWAGSSPEMDRVMSSRASHECSRRRGRVSNQPSSSIEKVLTLIDVSPMDRRAKEKQQRVAATLETEHRVLVVNWKEVESELKCGREGERALLGWLRSMKNLSGRA